MRKRTTYSPEEKLKIIRDVFSRKATIQKIAKEKNISPTLISLWKKQADEAMADRFRPQPKGRRKTHAPKVVAQADVRALKNEARKAKIKAAHLEASLKEVRSRAAGLEKQVAALVATMGFKLVKARRRRNRKA